MNTLYCAKCEQEKFRGLFSPFRRTQAGSQCICLTCAANVSKDSRKKRKSKNVPSRKWANNALFLPGSQWRRVC